MRKKFERKDIDLAYRKLKSYVYYDNFSLLLRQQIAEFESDNNFEDRLSKLVTFLNAPVNKKGNFKPYFESLLSEITCFTAPKKFSRKDFNYGDNIISNNFTQNRYLLEKVNYFFKGPVELHIISILWIIKEGYALHKDYQKDNYAYYLELNSENGNPVDGLRLFKPYFDQYQKWRDKGVDLAKNIVADDTDVVILSLDVKEYYYNISFNPDLQDKVHKKITTELGIRGTLFTQMIFDINDAYQKICPKDSKAIMPIGILSSGILANWYLTDFDKRIKEELAPAYYGRYVDDILIVLSNTKISKTFDTTKFNSPLEAFLDKFFVERKIFTTKTEEKKTIHKSKNDDCICEEIKKEINYQFISNELIEIQKEKIILYSFESKESQAVLDMFKKKIEQHSSAFWFLPNENDINDDFDESVYELNYTDTVNKLRSVSDIKQSKYGASIFLAKRIKISLLSDNKKDDKTTEQILTFFKGIVNLEFSNLWEKVLTYFVIADDRKAFWKFFKETIHAIDSIKAFDKRLNNKDIENTQKYLGEFLMNCCAMATALNPNFVNQNWWEDRCKNYKFKWFNNTFYKHVYRLKREYITSNLLRNSFVVVPLLNYLKITNEYNTNLVKYDYLREFDINFEKGDLAFDQKKLLYAPRFIYLHEFNSIEFLKSLIFQTKEGNLNVFEDFDQNIYHKNFETFFKVNHEYRNTFYVTKNGDEVNNYSDNLKNYYFKIEKGFRSADQKLGYNTFDIPQSKEITNDLKIAIANTKVSLSDIKQSLFDLPNTKEKQRRVNFINLVNGAEKVKADILILPEVSIPYKWLPILADQARRKQRAIIVGLEHIRINNVCYNLLATILPMEHNGIKDAIISLRLKNHYSPAETKLIIDRGKKVPKLSKSLYNLFIWRGVHFSNYNCYELADIHHRALFKSKVDVLFASEYNADVNYFSNIVETVSRDIHCYFVQVNSSDFGDSRITKPAKTEAKDILRLKGGENSVVLLGKIDIKELREFQKTRITGQDTRIFKNTPPDFEHKYPENR